MARGTLSVTILHTNDMHADLPAMSRLSAFLRQLRAELQAEGRRVFYFDAGDAADRRVQWISATKGAAFPQVLAAMGCDLQTLGNGISVTYGLQAASAMADRADFPILAANFFQDGEPLVPGFIPFQVFELNDQVSLKVSGQAPYAPRIYSLFGLSLDHYVDCAREWAQRLDGLPGPLVMVNHLGLREDHEVASGVPEIDVIIGGHSHSMLPEGEFAGDVLIAQAGQYAGYLGRVDLEVDAHTGKVLSKTARLAGIPADQEPDPLVEAAIARAEEEARQVLAQPVVRLPEALEANFFAESALGNFAADALRRRMDAEIGLVASGLLHKGLPAGVLTLGQLNEACFTTANPMLSLLSGQQVLEGLEKGLKEENAHAYYKSYRGSPVGIPQVSGLRVICNADAPDGKKIKELWVGENPVDVGRLYRVAHTDAECEGGGAFLEIEESQVLRTEVPTILREVLEEDLRRGIPRLSDLRGRWVKA
jgi:2',3'-cyclic-nucleotide 2'-phosphodiesterase (5'-nucleotidase family)